MLRNGAVPSRGAPGEARRAGPGGAMGEGAGRVPSLAAFITPPESLHRHRGED